MDANRKNKSAFLFAQTKTLPKGLDPRLLAAIREAPLLSKDAEVALTRSIVDAVGACWHACASAFVRESRREEMLAAARLALASAPQEDEAPTDAPADPAAFALAPQSSTSNTIASIRARDLDWYALRAAQAFSLAACDATTSTHRSSVANVQRATEARRAILSTAAHLDRLVDRMTRANMRLVLLIGSKERPGLPYADLVQEGSIGLLKAIRRFDPARGFRFSTYAVHWIRADLGRANDNGGTLIRRPVHVIDITPKAIRAHEQLAETLGRKPTVAEVAKVIKRSEEVAAAALAPTRIISTNATDPRRTTKGDNPTTVSTAVGDSIPDPNPGDWASEASHAEDIAAVRAGVDLLGDRERDIVKRYYGMNDDGETSETFAAIGATMNLSRERVRQIEAKAVCHLRRIIPGLEGAAHS